MEHCVKGIITDKVTLAFKESLRAALTEMVAGGYQSHSYEYAIGNTAVSWRNWILIFGTAAESEATQKLHSAILETIVGSQQLADLKTAAKALKETDQKLLKEIQILRLRHYFPGSCMLCPTSK